MLRVGYVLGTDERIAALMQQKMLSGMTTSAINEHLALLMWQDSRSDKQLSQWRSRLAGAQQHLQKVFTQLGWHTFGRPQSGMYLYAKHPAIADAYHFAQTHHDDNITLAPGLLFAIDQSQANPWLRFNVAYCMRPEFEPWLRMVTPKRP